MPGMGTQKRALRASCDNCHQAKVKCVATAAGCQRCVALNTLCVHSPPGRSGRVPTANKEHIPTPPRSSPSRPQSDQVSIMDFTTDSVMMEPVDSMLSDWFSMSAATTAAMSPLYSGGTQGVLIDPSISTFSMGTPTAAPISEFVPGDLSAPSQSQIPPSSASTQHPPQPLLPGQPQTQPQQQTHLLYTPPPKNHPPSSSTSTCTCFQTIVRALEKIQTANMRLLSMDVALSQNKESLIHICNALKCTSPHDSTTRLLMLVLLRKNLNLYNLLYHSRLRNRRDRGSRGSRGSSGGSPFSGNTDFDTDTTLGSRHPSDAGLGFFSAERHDEMDTSVPPTDFTAGGGGSGVAGATPSTVRLSLGSYTLDHADESSLTKQILLLDVNKVPRLLERLDRRACGLDEADGLDLYNMMRSALIAEFRAIMTEVDS
ncbi:hypothetical protein ASPCAL05286 [Aspergillus calidoustus]|uniref:Zn(2)-C6 fungal-type domain-containing protein n=1 Tax=Aspergillus calidoustus TaxID=454130 RepID=A0A0U5C6M1_ASPCI|nr:hypothetical protein ASPCAL05286 [Aspergillus calidoustus]